MYVRKDSKMMYLTLFGMGKNISPLQHIFKYYFFYLRYELYTWSLLLFTPLTHLCKFGAVSMTASEIISYFRKPPLKFLKFLVKTLQKLYDCNFVTNNLFDLILNNIVYN